MTLPYTAQQNGSAERENRTMLEAARTMLLTRKLPGKLWADAVNTAVYVLNRSGHTKADDTSLYELWTGKKAPIDHLKIFGTECFVHVPKSSEINLMLWQRKISWWDIAIIEMVIRFMCQLKMM